MPRSDYEHWNEDADWVWWQEEGKHQPEPEYCENCGGSHSSFSCNYYQEDE